MIVIDWVLRQSTDSKDLGLSLGWVDDTRLTHLDFVADVILIGSKMKILQELTTVVGGQQSRCTNEF